MKNTIQSVVYFFALLGGLMSCNAISENHEMRYEKIQNRIKAGTYPGYEEAIADLQDLSKKLNVAKAQVEKRVDDVTKNELGGLLTEIQKQEQQLKVEQLKFQRYATIRSKSQLYKLKALLDFLEEYAHPPNKASLDSSMAEMAGLVSSDIRQLTNLYNPDDFYSAKEKATDLIRYLSEAELSSDANIDCNLEVAIERIRMANSIIRINTSISDIAKRDLEDSKQELENFCSTLATIASDQRNLIQEEILAQINYSTQLIQEKACDAVKKRRIECTALGFNGLYGCNRDPELVNQPEIAFSNNDYKVSLRYHVCSSIKLSGTNTRIAEVLVDLIFPFSNCQLGQMQINQVQVLNFECR